MNEEQQLYGLHLNNVEDVVELGLCIGCMACAGSCPLGALEVNKGALGFPAPVKPPLCDNCGACLTDCPMIKSEDDGSE